MYDVLKFCEVRVIIKLWTLFVFLFFCIGGCSYYPNDTNAYRARPDWVYNPSGVDYIGGVGYSGVHINGKSGQRKLAVSRAIDEIARQLGVKVDSVVSTKLDGDKSGSFSKMNVFSVQTVKGEAFSAIITDMWEDSEKGELYVYMRLLAN